MGPPKNLTIYVTLDTNILVRLVSQGMPGCETQHWDKLKSLASSSKIIVLITEVVLLEFTKQWVLFQEKLKIEAPTSDEMLKKLNSGKQLWSELRDFPGALEEFISQFMERKTASAIKLHEDIQTFMESGIVVQIPFTTEVLLCATKRKMAGLMGKPDKASEPDCCIVESLSDFFKNVTRSSYELLLCTENHNDFGLIEPTHGMFHVHPNIAEALPNTLIFTKLSTVISHLENHKSVKQPSSRQVKDALELAATQSISEKMRIKHTLNELEEDLENLGLNFSDMETEYKRFTESSENFIDQLYLVQTLGGPLLKMGRKEKIQFKLNMDLDNQKTAYNPQSISHSIESYRATLVHMNQAENIANDLLQKGLWNLFSRYRTLKKRIGSA